MLPARESIYYGSSTSERFIMLPRSKMPSSISFSTSSVRTTFLSRTSERLKKSVSSVDKAYDRPIS
jgi:hypothetical protein